jgi:hypothetical protein
MRQTALRPQFVEFIPEQLEDGVLYVSQRYGTAMHLCCCGCGSEVVTPLNPAGWTLEIVNGGVTLRPSIGSWSLPCRSHYLIRQGKVVWARDMSREEIEDGRLRDERLRDIHIADANRRKEAATEVLPFVAQHPDFWVARCWRAIRAWLGLAD